MTLYTAHALSHVLFLQSEGQQPSGDSSTPTDSTIAISVGVSVLVLAAAVASLLWRRRSRGTRDYQRKSEDSRGVDGLWWPLAEDAPAVPARQATCTTLSAVEQYTYV